MRHAIGGYFELELPPPRASLYPMALSFQSARAAFLALLRTGKPARIFMPYYLCDSMLAPVEKAGVNCVFYSLDADFDIVDDITLGESDWLLYVNYFGICGPNIDRLRNRHASAQLILDHSHAFYAAPTECLATIYSPRKFFGVPDGGLLVTAQPVAEPINTEQGSLARARAGMTRLAETAEAGYAAYKEAENSLAQCEPMKMSQLSRRILQSVDVEAVRLRRNANFAFLHQQLAARNLLGFDASCVDGPLCYPLLTDVAGLHEHLLCERIFVAKYWPEVACRVGQASCEFNWTRNLLPLPIDQRYSKDDMQIIADICLYFISSN